MTTRFWMLLALLPSWVAAAEGGGPALGRLEHINIDLNKPVLMTAALDTGSEYSTLNVDRVEAFELNYQNWVRFRIAGQSVEKPVVRYVEIKPKGSERIEPRRFVTLDFCLRNMPMSADFALQERNGQSAPVVLGMNVLEGMGPVDPAARFTREPNCSRPETLEMPQPVSGF